MSLNLPSRRELKMQARRLMTHPMSIRASLLLACVAMAFFGLRYLLNATLTYSLVSLADYGETASGVYVQDEGINLIFRMDLTGLVLALAMTYRQIRTFLLVNGVFFLLLAPLRVGVMEVFWKILRRDKEIRILDVFQWFLQLGRLFKAWIVEFLLNGFVRGVALAASLPSMYLYYRFYSVTPDVANLTTGHQLMQGAAGCLAIAAFLVAFWVHSLFLPVRYCLAAHPEYSLGQTFRRGFQSARGVRGPFFRFRLSYALWFFLSQMTYGAMDIFVAPYSSLGSMVFLQEAARARRTAARQEQMSEGAESDGGEE